MKKVMLFIASMLLATSVSAATMSWVDVEVIDTNNSSTQIAGHQGTHATRGEHVDNIIFNIDEPLSINAVAIEFFDSQLDIASIMLDGLYNFTFSTLGGNVSQWLLGNTLLGAGDHTIALAVNQAVAGGQFNLKINAVSEVPVPAALLLFAPALLGFMGLRRKSQNIVA
jgi:hypothetical protein